MLLAVDIGNSQTSIGIFENQRLRFHWRAETKVSRTSDEYAALLLPLFEYEQIELKDCEGVVLCSVVPPAEYAFDLFCESYLHRSALKIDSRLNLGFTVNVKMPSEVGADRLANVAYAIEYLKLPAIVVDFGTATTLDVVSQGKVYEGGAILPGVRIAVEALSLRTSKLPFVDLKFPESVIGKTTVECIQAGVLYGFCDLIDGLLERTKKEQGRDCEIALTGGLAFLFENRLKSKSCNLPNLTLEGMELLYRQNQG